MLERLVEFVLASKLRRVISDFNRDSFSIWLWQGRVVMHNIQLSPSLCGLLNLPVELIHGSIATLDITIPWRALGTQGVEVRVNGVELLLKTVPTTGWQFSETDFLARIRDALQFESSRLHMLDQSLSEKQEPSYLSNLSEKLLKNLEVELRNVHIRLEREDSNFATGLVFESILCESEKRTDDPDLPLFGKKLSLSGMYVYAQVNEKAMLAGKLDLKKEMEDLMCRFLCGEEHASVICPIALEVGFDFNGRDEELMYRFKVVSKEIDLHLTQLQYQNLYQLWVLLCAYSNFTAESITSTTERFQAFLDSNPTDATKKQEFKLTQAKIKAGSTLQPSEERRYNALISTTSIEDLYQWLFELHGELAHSRKSRFSWVTSWFAGNQEIVPTTETQLDSIRPDILTLDLEIQVSHVRVTLEGRRTTNSDYVYRLQADVEEAGCALVAKGQNIHLAMHVATCIVQFQDPISFTYIPLFQFNTGNELKVRVEEQMFLIINQEGTSPGHTTVSLELESCQCICCLNIITQMQTFFAVCVPDLPVSNTHFQPQLQSLWNSVEMDLHIKPSDIIFLADESLPSHHILMSLGDLTLVKVASVSLASTGLKHTNDRLTLNIKTCRWVIVSGTDPPLTLFTVTQEVNFEVRVGQEECSSVEFIGEFPMLEIRIAKKTYLQLRDFTQKFLTPNSTDAPFVDIRKKEIIGKTRERKIFDIVWRHHKQQWQSYFTVLVNNYLYFFSTASDTLATHYFSLNTCTVRDPVSERILGLQDSFEPFEEEPKYQFILVSEDGERGCRLGFDTSEKCKEWVSWITRSSRKLDSFPHVTHPLTLTSLSLSLSIPSFALVLEQEEAKEHKQIHIAMTQAELKIDLQKRQWEVRFAGSPWIYAIGSKAPLKFRELVAPGSGVSLVGRYSTETDPVLSLSLHMEEMRLAWNHSIVANLQSFLSVQEPGKTPKNAGERLSASINVTMDALSLTLNNDVERFTFGEISLKNIQIDLNLPQIAVQFTLFTISDLSNYPESSKVTPESVISPLVLMRIAGNTPTRISIAPDHIRAEISDVEIVYLQQPFMRIVNCLLVHIPMILQAKGVGKGSNCTEESLTSIPVTPESHSFAEEQVTDQVIEFTIRNMNLTLPPHPSFLLSGKFFELLLPLVSITVSLDKETIPARLGVIRKVLVSIPETELVRGSKVLIAGFPLEIAMYLPVLTKSGLSDLSIDSSVTLEVAVVAPMYITFSQEDYTLLLNLNNLNLGYDDHLDKLIVPCAAKKTFNDLRKFMVLRFYSKELSLLLTLGEEDLVEFILTSLEIGLETFNDGYLNLELETQMLESLRPEGVHLVETHNPFQQHIVSDRPRHRLSFEMIRPTVSELPTPMLTFRMRKDRLGNKTMTGHLRHLHMVLDAAFLQEIMNFLTYATPDYSKEEVNCLAFMTEFRPNPQQTFDPEIDLEFLGSLLDFEVIIKDSEFALPKTEFLCSGDIRYALVKQNEKQLRTLKGKQVCSSVQAHMRNFCIRSNRDRGESNRSVLTTEVLEKTEIAYNCRYFQDLSQTPQAKVNTFEACGVVDSCHMTLTISDIELFAAFLGYQMRLIQQRRTLIDDLATGRVRDNPFEIGEERASVRSSDFHGVNSSSLATSQMTQGKSYLQVPNSPIIQDPDLQPKNSLQYTLGLIDIMLIDDKNGLYRSLLWIKGKEEDYKGELDPSFTTQFLLRANVQINLYNQVADVWEPLMENCFVGYKSGVQITDRGRVSEEVIYIEKVMVNFTETQIKTLVYVASNCMSETSAIGSKLVVASPFTILNLTGYPLHFLRDNLSAKLLPGTSYPVTLPNAEARQLSPILSLAAENHTGRYALPELKANIVSSSQLDIGNPAGPEDYHLFCDVEMEKSRKVVKIRAPIVFLNETTHDFQVTAEASWGRKTWDCVATTESALPYDCQGNIRLSITHESVLVLEVEDLWTKLELGLNEHILLSDNRSFVCMHVEAHRKHSHRYIIKVLSPVSVSNALPLQCEISLSNSASDFTPNRFEPVSSGFTLISYDVRHDQDVYIKLRIPGFAETEGLKMFNSKKKKMKRAIKLTDKTECHAEVYLSFRFAGRMLVTLHAPIIIDNMCPLSLVFHYKKTGIMHRVAGQQTDLIQTDMKQVICDEAFQVRHSLFFCCLTKKLQIEYEKRKSEAFKIGTIGAQKVITIEGQKERDGEFTLYQLVFNVRFIWPLDDNNIYCRLVTVSPRFILNNMLLKPLLLYQVGSRKPMVLRSQTSVPFFWPDGRKQELLKLSIAEKEKWDWSGTFSISSIGACTLQCLEKSSGTYELVRMEVRQQDITGVVTFQGENIDHPAYLLENNSDTFSIVMHQEGYAEYERFIDVRSMAVYAWASPMHTHMVVLRFLYGALSDFPLDTKEQCSLNPDLLNKTQRVRIPFTKYKGVYIYIKVFSRGSTKVVQVNSEKQSTSRKKEHITSSIALVIPQIGISIVENAPTLSSELLFISIRDFELEGSRSTSLQHLDLTIKKVQIDNQYNPLALYPVFLTIRQVEEKPAVQLQLSYYLSGESDCYNIERCELLVQEMSLEAESLVVQRLIGMSSRITSELQLSQMTTSRLTIEYRSSGSAVIDTNSTSHLTQTSTIKIENLKQISFGYLKIHPILISVTFAPLKDIFESDGMETFDILINALGLTIMNIKAAPMKFFAVELRNVFGARWQLLNAVSAFYKAQVASEIFSIVGHADVLGNPLGILNNLGEGVADLFYEPYKGVMHGPVSAGKGLVKGAKSFFQKTISATFGTVSRLAGTLSAGLNSVTSDRSYQLQLQKDRARNQPKDVVEGLGIGMKALVKSVSKGITGVVEEPVKGAKKNGFTGLLKGGLKGFGGLVVKPITGLLDVTSQATEGIVNTADMFDKKPKSRRVRLPRVTYHDSGIIKSYNEEDAEVLHFMIQLKRDKYIYYHFVQQVLDTDAKGETMLYVHFLECLVLISIGEHKVTWLVPTEEIETVVRTRHGVVVCSAPSKRKVRNI